jgi:transposase
MRLQDETDPNILRQAALLLEKENQRLVQKILELTRELVALKGGGAEHVKRRIADLERQLAKRNQMLFGDTSEKREGDGPKEPVAEPPKPPQKGHGPKPQPKLEVVEVIHEHDAADRMCPSCGGDLEAWAGQFEESDEIDVIERRFYLKKHKRQKYRCRCGGCVETAPAPLKLFEGARYSVNFAIEVVVDKYSECAPLERQVRKMGREGLDVDSQTLWDQSERLARLLRPGYEGLTLYILSKPELGADETRWPLLNKKNNNPKDWHAWAIVTEDGVVYQIHDGRSAEEGKKVLGGYKGVVTCDGYGVYQSLAKKNPGLVLAHCWAHVRRKYIEIEREAPQEAKTALDLIRGLYAVEELCPKGPAGDALRLQLRKERSEPIIEALRSFALTTSVVPGNGLDAAIKYMAGLWSGLTRFLDNPRIPLDNNHTERAQRAVVLGRKNHYGSRSRRGTEVAALFYSYIESAKLCGLDPKAYLRTAVMAALRGERIPLPHEVAAQA